MNKVIEMFKKHKDAKKIQKQKKQEQFLMNYFSILYRIQDYGKLQIPYFLRAQQAVEDIKRRGLLEDVYKYIYKSGCKIGGKVSC